MPIFFLEPKRGDTSGPHWDLTSLKEGCWVIAGSETAARKCVEAATAQWRTDHRPGDASLHSPWSDPQLTDCRPDSSYLNVAEGVIVTVSGKVIA